MEDDITTQTRDLRIWILSGYFLDIIWISSGYYHSVIYPLRNSGPNFGFYGFREYLYVGMDASKSIKCMVLF